jgi:S1-C subfamily serine protease
MSVNSSNNLWSNVSADFIGSVADAKSLEIFTEEGRLLTSLDMKDSADTLNAVVACVRNHAYAPGPVASSPPRPEAKSTPDQEIVLTGTGFFVAPNWLVTNNHVVKDCRQSLQIKKPDEPSHDAYLRAQDGVNDIALLRTDFTNPSVASFRHKAQVGERVATYGFPYAGLLSSSGNFTSGEVTAPTGMKDDTRFVQISTRIQPGNSGGPLLDMFGNIVGMVVAQLNAAVMMRLEDSIPQNVNFAIRSAIITNFLSAKGISPKVAAEFSRDTLDRGRVDVYELAKDFTVQLSCKGVPSDVTSKNQASGWKSQ